jgi:histidinol phosphatase-like PHP family hydrolase
VVINSDGHSAGEVARHFDRARQLALDAGYTELVGFERRQRFSYPL